MNVGHPVEKRWQSSFWLVILIGIFLRFIPVLLSDFPINDGGMFLSMIRDLRANGFILPRVTTYNYSDIPFAYPPFGFYVAGLVSLVFPGSDIALLRWIPAIVSAAIIPVFYWLALRIFGNTPRTFISVMLVAVVPGIFDWLLMGGGLSRSFGLLFFLLAVGYVLRLFRDSDNRSLPGAILFCTLAILSHPEAGLQTVGICFLIWFLFGRNRPAIRNAFLLAIGTALGTAPWWLTVIIFHGISPIYSAVQTGIHETFLPSLFHSFFSLQGGLPILPVLTLLGLFTTMQRREFFLFGWAFLPFIIDPRNAPAVAQYAFILLASEGLFFLWIGFRKAYSRSIKSDDNSYPYADIIASTLFAFLGIYLLWSTVTSEIALAQVSLREGDRKTMEWININTHPAARFLLMTNDGQISPMTDAYQEWFPALAERRSINTLQGMEWSLGGGFYEYSLRLIDLQACRDSGCLQEWISENGEQVDYLLIRTRRVSPDLLRSVGSQAGYQAIYESEDTKIYQIEP